MESTAIASVVSTVVTRLIFHPFDTMRTLQQTSTAPQGGLPLYRYWRGCSVSICMTAPAYTLYLASYKESKIILSEKFGKDSLATYLLGGAVAELTSSFLWTPMEVIRGRMQLMTEKGTPSSLKVIKKIFDTEGLKGFYRGYFMGIVVFLPHSVVWWVSYEKAKNFFRKHSWSQKKTDDKSLSIVDYSLAASFAATTACASSNFLDLIKTRQQLAASEEIRALRPDDQTGILKLVKNLLKEVGFRKALFKGFNMRLLSQLPATVVGIVLVEKMSGGI